MFAATASNELSVGSSEIAYIACDAVNYPGNIDAVNVVSQALTNNAIAVLLYSTTSQTCSVAGAGSQYPNIFTMESLQDSQNLLNAMERPSGNAFRISIETGSNAQNSTGGGNNSANQSSSGTSPTTAIAMIILYSITGVITGTFLVIIVVGAVRAHRHPERYGPRNVFGGARQSRARGIARAMLDTIPIVKFGDRDAAKPADVELAPTEQVRPETVIEDSTKTPTHVTRDLSHHNESASIRSGIGPAAADTIQPEAATTNPAAPEDVPGCSICTEDFEAGQDLRVLPCDHKFHPACIDPWLLNVSGTCPLCRIDLHPTNSHEEGQTEDGLPPPIDIEGGGVARPSIRRSILMGFMGVRPMHDASSEERIAAARAMRRNLEQARTQDTNANRASIISNNSGTEESRRRRFSTMFGIRTRQRPLSTTTAPTLEEGGVDEVVEHGRPTT